MFVHMFRQHFYAFFFPSAFIAASTLPLISFFPLFGDELFFVRFWKRPSMSHNGWRIGEKTAWVDNQKRFKQKFGIAL